MKFMNKIDLLGSVCIVYLLQNKNLSLKLYTESFLLVFASAESFNTDHPVHRLVTQ